MQLYSELGKTVYSGRAKEYLIGLLMSSAKKTVSTSTKLSKNLLVSIDFPNNMVRVDRWEAVGHGQLHVARCSPDCRRRRRCGAPAWFHQYDAWGLGQHIPTTHAASRAAAIHRHHRYHVDGLDHGEIIKRKTRPGRSQ